MNIQLSVHDWLELPMPVRNKLSQAFSIPKSRGSIVESDKVISDGHTYEDLAAITVEKMQDFLQSGEPDFVKLFHQVIEVVDILIKDEARGEQLKVPSKEELMVADWSNQLRVLKDSADNMGMLPHLAKLATIILDIKPTTINASPKKRTSKKSN